MSYGGTMVDAQVWRRVAAAVVLAVSGAVLLACASLSEAECRGGDWRGIGFSDGAEGRDADYIARHRKACAEVGVSPDLQAWLAGRAEGLKAYCTPQKAYEVGRRGASLARVCTASQLASMQSALFFGQQYYEFSQEQERLRSDQAEIEQRIAEIPRDATGDAARDRRRLRNEYDRLDRRIRQLDYDKRRVDSWPV